ncbi:DNL zinc finger-domain-containing protein [Rhodotorula diobovata]|uniref:DNL zinc finger-domain-containing protein n=1 Tax=Rhodotorula diobovata TaxID=5288 RepID=A0A5C5FMZ8_9BASI|nr:DNL zinc finger-domain-containing protein [Rhodotorula diobovata]
MQSLTRPATGTLRLATSATRSTATLLVSRAPRRRLPSQWSPSSLSSLVPHHRPLHSTRPHLDDAQHPRVPLNSPTGTPIGQLDRRLRITFTCTAPAPSPDDGDGEGGAGKQCGHRSSHEFSKRSYDKGVVIVQCPGCNNRHLIADHLHWFSQTPSPSHPTGQPIGAERPRTVEDLLAEKGESVRRGSIADGGEFAGEREGEVRWRVSERVEGDGGRTVEVGPVEEGEGGEGGPSKL